jgi:ATP/maltotriose-dependent transcriptional regulator MalT
MDFQAKPRLISRLDRGLKERPTITSAPDGYCETALAMQWLYQCSKPSAWLSLGKSDSDTEHLLKYLVATLCTAVPQFIPLVSPLWIGFWGMCRPVLYTLIGEMEVV